MKSYDNLTALLPGYTRFPSPAKLNLFLYINGKLPNGYHELQTLFQFLDFYDWLDIQPRADGIIRITPKIQSLPQEQNLIYRAARLLQQHTGCTQGADIVLHKYLPMGGGIGGGSSNAATALVALNYLWNTKLDCQTLAQLGLSLGADVPVFVKGHAAFAEGVGEKLQPCRLAENYFVVVKPAVNVATAAIFADPKLPRDTAKKSLTQLLNEPFTNDCEKTVLMLYPEIAQAWQQLNQFAPTRLTGTGACIFAEFSRQSDAELAATTLKQRYFAFVAKGMNQSPLTEWLMD